MIYLVSFGFRNIAIEQGYIPFFHFILVYNQGYNPHFGFVGSSPPRVGIFFLAKVIENWIFLGISLGYTGIFIGMHQVSLW